MLWRMGKVVMFLQAVVAARVAAGKSRKKVVPLPGSLSTKIRPLFRSMIWRTIKRPRPVPFPGSLVVKKGSSKPGNAL